MHAYTVDVYLYLVVVTLSFVVFEANSLAKTIRKDEILDLSLAEVVHEVDDQGIFIDNTFVDCVEQQPCTLSSGHTLLHGLKLPRVLDVDFGNVLQHLLLTGLSEILRHLFHHLEKGACAPFSGTYAVSCSISYCGMPIWLSMCSTPT